MALTSAIFYFYTLCSSGVIGMLITSGMRECWPGSQQLLLRHMMKYRNGMEG